jgi:hypothetical protein
MCSWLVNIPRMQPRALSKRDKRGARRMLAKFVAERALEHGRLLDDAEVEALLGERELFEQLAICVYARELLARIAGAPTGPEVLALWRMFATRERGRAARGRGGQPGERRGGAARAGRRGLRRPPSAGSRELHPPATRRS